jgi:tripartite-type tricarboxylate transporter receptor subunit TctC
MITRRVFLSEGAAVGLNLIPAAFAMMPAKAADYPAGPVKVIVPQAAGGSLDVIMRIVAEHLEKSWRKQAIIINLPGAGGVLAARAAATAAPDGYTLLMAPMSIYTILPEAQTTLPFNVADFVPIAFISEQPFGIVISSSLGVTSLPELIALSKKQSGGINCAVGVRNQLAHLTGELFRIRSGANLNFIYYPGTAQSLNDVIAGRVPVLVQILPGMTGAIAGGQVKLLSVTSLKRLRSFPEVPAASEAVPGFAVSGWNVLVAPRGTTAPIAQRISNDLLAAQARSALKDRLEEFGAYTRPMSPDQVADFVRREQEFWRPLVRDALAKS